MTTPQLIAFAIILASLILFAWGRWRYDIVAMGALVVAVICGIVPSETAFSGFSDPAVITVAAVLILSQSLQRSGAINLLAGSIGKLPNSPMIQIGALALMLPVAIRAAQASNIPMSRVLMPIAFGSLLGGLATLIGTPPNIIISSYRAEVMDKSFGEGGGSGVFDFVPVGALAALIGIIFIVTIGCRLIPHREGGDTALEDLM